MCCKLPCESEKDGICNLELSHKCYIVEKRKPMNLQQKLNDLRDEVIRIAVKNKAGHLASSLSCHNILVALYYSIMTKDDHLIFSKAHGCYSLYAILADLGKLPRDQWENFNTDKSQLTGCSSFKPEWGIEAGCGSLGHGLPMAVGIAYAMKLQNKPGVVYCIVGDGELEEGTTYEALSFAFKHDINNLVTIVDANLLRALDTVGESFLRIPEYKGIIINDNMHDLHEVLCANYQFVVVNTTKGKGLVCMENKAKFHFRVPTTEELNEGKTY